MHRWLLIGWCTLCLGTAAPAASIQARLIRAANEKQPAEVQLRDIDAPLRQVFGYAHYYLLGRQVEPLVPDKWVKLNLGEGFSILVRPGAARDSQYPLEVEIYSGKTALAKAAVNLAPGKPVLIKGPEVGSTLMVIALSVRE